MGKNILKGSRLVTLNLDEKLKIIAQSPVLLVASDYDGTLSPIVVDPMKAKPHREGMVALQTLSELPQTHTAIISGRSLEVLSKLIKTSDGIHLVGSHGSEFDLGFEASLPKRSIALKQKIEKEMKKAVGKKKGFYIEKKPASVGLHFRNANKAEAKPIVEKLQKKYKKIAGVFIKHGKEVIEFTILKTNKGRALERIRHRVGSHAVIFLGDDLTDEDAFKSLSGPDISIKVGDGKTAAQYRVKDTKEVASVLAKLCELRCKWLEGASADSIESHSLLSDLRTTVLLSPRGRVVWACLPRIDSNPLFSELLGGPTAGYFSFGLLYKICSSGVSGNFFNLIDVDRNRKGINFYFSPFPL